MASQTSPGNASKTPALFFTQLPVTRCPAGTTEGGVSCQASVQLGLSMLASPSAEVSHKLISLQVPPNNAVHGNVLIR